MPHKYMVMCCFTDALHLHRYAISALVLIRIFPSKLGGGNASYEYMAIYRFTDALHLRRATGKRYVARLSIVESFHRKVISTLSFARCIVRDTEYLNMRFGPHCITNFCFHIVTCAAIFLSDTYTTT
jgi:hypothetical protein